MNAPTSTRSVCRTLASSTALLGALGMMGFSGAAQAGAAGVPQCSGNVGAPFERSSEVKDLVTDDGNGTWSYEFRVCNTTDGQYGQFALRDWELPWDHTASNPIDVNSIVVPQGWAWSIETRDVFNSNTLWEGEITWQDVGPDGVAGTADDDPFYDPRFATQPQVLHFYTGCSEGNNQAFGAPSLIGHESPSCSGLPDAWVLPGDDLAGFGFDASVGPTNAPYQASWVFVPPRSGDPAFPLAGGTALSSAFFPPSAVPEPSSVALLAASLGGIAGAAAVRRRREDDEDSGESSNG